MFNELKTRGMQDMLIAVTDGLKAMKQALSAVFPSTTLQTCIVNLIRSNLDYASWKERRAVAAALKPIYTAPTVEFALAAPDEFERGLWGQRYHRIRQALAQGLAPRDPQDGALQGICHREFFE